MSKYDIIAWGKEEEAILRINECNLIGGIWQLKENYRFSIDVSSLKVIVKQ